MPSAEPPSPGEAGAASQNPPHRASRRTPWLLLGLLAAAVAVAAVAMLGWNSAITRADQQTSRAAAAQAAAAERSRVGAQARVDAPELAVGAADRRPPAGAVPAAPAPAPPAAPLAAAPAGAPPALPLPGLPADATARDYLVAARQAIQAGDAGEAQASLERAETRLLNRASLAAGPNRPLRHPGVTEIEQALDQLGASDGAGALATIDRLLGQQ